jgi:hypothetical protein
MGQIGRTAHAGFSIIGEVIALVRRDGACQLLLLLFGGLYGPQAFIMAQDLGLITAFETDPGSHMQAIEALLKTYNMHAGYHSRFYGWTYFALNFFLLSPLSVTLHALHITDRSSIYLSIRLILLGLGASSVVLFYALLKELFVTTTLPVIGTILYILSPVSFTYFYIVHPDVTGSCCVFLAALYLVRFARQPEQGRLYFPMLVCLVLAALSKQIFFFVALPILLGFFHIHARAGRQSYASAMASRGFWQAIGLSLLISLLIAASIHPYAFIQFHKFLEYQSVLGGFVQGENVLTLPETLRAWKIGILGEPLLIVCLALVPAWLLVGGWRYYRTGSNFSFLFLLSLGAILAIGTLIVVSDRLFPGTNYLHPIYPFILILVLVTLRWLGRQKWRAVRVGGLAVATYALTIILALAIQLIVPTLNTRLHYKDSISYLTYEWLHDNLKPNDRFVYDHFVGVPTALQFSGCHYWSTCAGDYIKNFNPDFIIFNPDYEINNRPFVPTEHLKHYIDDNHMALIAKITSTITDTPITVEVYKKPE